MDLRKFVAPEFVFGAGSIELIPNYIKNYGARKIMLVSDPGVQKAGWTTKTQELLENSDINYTLFTDVTPNPRVQEVMRGAEIFDEEKCDSIVAVGGGSVIDCAKGIGIVARNGKNIIDFEGVDKVEAPMPPMICIPTTGGTSADVSQFAIISNRAIKNKIAIISKQIVPDIALVDPTTLTTMSAGLTSATGIDALVHAIEAYVSNASSIITDIHALKGIELITSNLLQSIADPMNIELRSNIMLGSLEAGLAFSNASLGAVHAMAHSLGGLLDLPHGECNAMLLPHVMKFNYKIVPEKFEILAKFLDLDIKGVPERKKSEMITNAVLEFKQKAGIAATLSDIGVRSSDIPELAKKAIKDPCILTNPRNASKRDIEVIYEEAI